MIITAICIPPDTPVPEPIPVGGRTVFLPDAATAAQFAEAGAVIVQPLLSECAPRKPFTRTPPEIVERAKALIAVLLEHGSDCVLAAPPNFLRVLLRQMERGGFVIRRGQSGVPKPMERIRITQKRDHCGGCSHNCLLKNPGCGVGRDKAARGF